MARGYVAKLLMLMCNKTRKDQIKRKSYPLKSCRCAAGKNITTFVTKKQHVRRHPVTFVSNYICMLP